MCEYKYNNSCNFLNPPMQGVVDWFCDKMCPRSKKYTSVLEFNQRRIVEQKNDKQAKHYRSLASYMVTICSGCPDRQTCQPYSEHIQGKSLCGCKTKQLADECPRKVYCKAIVNNWGYFRSGFGLAALDR